MDFELDGEQQAILDSVDVLLSLRAGPERAIALAAKGELDHDLARALREAGFLSLATEVGPLEAALLVERAARAAAVLDVGARALVAPALLREVPDVPVALVHADGRGPVRHAAFAGVLLVADGAVARLVRVEPGSLAPVRSGYGDPLGFVPEALRRSGEALGAGSGERLLRWWRLALALELSGASTAALATTVAYLKQRRQFGRAIGSFQAVQHRLARCAIRTEASRWLALEAAHHGAPGERVAVAAAHAADTAAQVFRETHQLSGAIGFTREHDLHVFSMRLQSLRLELGGSTAHARAITAERWAEGAP
ncbi:MAG: acyl-CoA dehydrogenase family protein [Myxococcota bacterium]|nr:acyl-CoA dehydrogenase family protein [Myxococcota bacterium]